MLIVLHFNAASWKLEGSVTISWQASLTLHQMLWVWLFRYLLKQPTAKYYWIKARVVLTKSDNETIIQEAKLGRVKLRQKELD